MKKTLLLFAVLLAVAVACTPKPEVQEPVVKYHEGRETIPAVSCRKEAPRIVNIVNFVREIEPRSTPRPGWKTVLDDSDMASTSPVILQKRQNKGIFVRI